MTIVSSVDEALEFIKKEYNTAQVLARNDFGKAEAFIPLTYQKDDIFRQSFSYVVQKKTYYSYSDYDTVDSINANRDSLFARIDRLVEADKILIQKNMAIAEKHKEIRKNITNMMTLAGIPTGWHQSDPKSRARNPKWITVKSAYFQDMDRYLPESPPVTERQLLQTASDMKKRIQEYYDKLIQSINEKERFAAQEQKEREKSLLLANLQVKYKLDFNTDLDDVVERLLTLDKYLDLAHAMLETRNDWSDGYDGVENALGRFIIDNETDKKISEYLSEIINSADGDIDGRVFRDCHWSYDVIFKMADLDLLIDYNKCIDYK